MSTAQEAIVGTFVEPRGMIRSAVAGAVGGVVGAAAAGSAPPDGGPLSKGQIAYLAVYPNEIVLFRAKRGAFKPKPTTDVIAVAPRHAIRSARIDKGKIAGVLYVDFADGASWQFEIARVYLGGAQRTVAVLGPVAA